MLKEDKLSPRFVAQGDETVVTIGIEDGLPAFTGTDSEADDEEVAVVISTIREHIERKR